MSDVILFKGQKVAQAFRHLDPTKNLGSGIVAGGFPVINYRGKQWSLRHQGQVYPFVRSDDGSPLTYLDVIIVGVSDYISKVFYPPGEWDEDSAGAPVCASVKGDVPDLGVPEPQSRTCGACQHNAWATQPNGRRGKACQDHKRLAVLLMPAVTAKMLGSPLTEPAYLKVPPGSLVSLKQYGDQLAHQGFHPATVITRVSFAPDKLFQMKFDGKQALTDKEAPLVLPLIDDPRTLRITGETAEIHEVAAAPAPKEEPVETGLMEAFSQPAQETVPPNNGSAPVKRGRGRPAGTTKPKPVVIENTPAEDEPNLMEMTAPAKAAPSKAKPVAPMQDTPWAEGDTELDREVSELLSQKVSNMLK
jgi:hypothetical protein